LPPRLDLYLDALARRLAARNAVETRVRLRTLLQRFGYSRRSRPGIAALNRALAVRGLTARLSMDAPASLDEWVTIRAALGQRAAGGAGPFGASRTGFLADGEPTFGLSDAAEGAIAATIEVRSADGSLAGTGFIVDASGLAVTARHVIEEDGRSLRAIQVGLSDGREARAVVFRSHRTLDYALLWIEADAPLPALRLGNPRELRHAETVLAIGHPSSFRYTVSRGVVCNPSMVVRNVEYIQNDAAIDRGHSGGPLINRRAEAVGLTVFVLQGVGSAKFALPLDYLAQEIRRALASGRAACLAAPYCRWCGHAHFDSPTWFCRNCGAQRYAEDPLRGSVREAAS
jgi:S1-C subfamily serine protease